MRGATNPTEINQYLIRLVDLRRGKGNLTSPEIVPFPIDFKGVRVGSTPFLTRVLSPPLYSEGYFLMSTEGGELRPEIPTL